MPSLPTPGASIGNWGTALNTWLGQGGQVYDVVAGYAADPTGVASSTTAIGNAISAASTAGGGTVYFPPGLYKANISLTSLSDVTLIGAGTASIIQPASGTAIALTSCTRCNVRNICLDGSGGGVTGLSVAGDWDSRFSDLLVRLFSGDGIYIPDFPVGSGYEIGFSHIIVRDCGAFAYHYSRTNNTDNGGVYFDRCMFMDDGAGTCSGGVRIASTVDMAADHLFTHLICDGWVGHPAFWVTNCAKVQISEGWLASVYNGGPTALFDGVGYANHIEGVYFTNGGTGAGTYDLTFAGTTSQTTLDNIHFDGANCTAYVHVSSTGANIMLGQTTDPATAPLTDTTSALYHRGGTNVPGFGPTRFWTEGGGTTGYVGIMDPANPTQGKYLVNLSDSLQFVDKAGTSTMFRIDDGGFVYCKAGIMPFGSNTGACTLYSGSGVPGSGLGADGDYYFRSDGVGGNVRLYFKTGGAWVGLMGTQSTLQTLVGSDTITTAGVSVARVTCTAARSGVILAVGTFDGQEVSVVNEGGFSVTFAVSGTSHVADGVSDVIATLTARKFVWDSGTSLWYRAG